jgi:hypothetical protein
MFQYVTFHLLYASLKNYLSPTVIPTARATIGAYVIVASASAAIILMYIQQKTMKRHKSIMNMRYSAFLPPPSLTTRNENSILRSPSYLWRFFPRAKMGLGKKTRTRGLYTACKL